MLPRQKMSSKERKRKKKHIFDYLLLVEPIKNGVTTKVSYDNQKCLLSLREHRWMCVHVCACVCVVPMSVVSLVDCSTCCTAAWAAWTGNTRVKKRIIIILSTSITSTVLRSKCFGCLDCLNCFPANSFSQCIMQWWASCNYYYYYYCNYY